MNEIELVLEKPAKDGIKELKSFLGNPKVNYEKLEVKKSEF